MELKSTILVSQHVDTRDEDRCCSDTTFWVSMGYGGYEVDRSETGIRKMPAPKRRIIRTLAPLVPKASFLTVGVVDDVLWLVASFLPQAERRNVIVTKSHAVAYGLTLDYLVAERSLVRLLCNDAMSFTENICYYCKMLFCVCPTCSRCEEIKQRCECREPCRFCFWCRSGKPFQCDHDDESDRRENEESDGEVEEVSDPEEENPYDHT